MSSNDSPNIINLLLSGLVSGVVVAIVNYLRRWCMKPEQEGAERVNWGVCLVQPEPHVRAAKQYTTFAIGRPTTAPWCNGVR